MSKQQGSGNSSVIRAVIFLSVAGVTGVAAVVILYQLFTTYQARIQEASKEEETRWVIVAASDLYQGVAIREEDIYAVKIPPRFLPLDGRDQAGIFGTPEGVIGRYPRERILSNEFIREDRLSDPEAGIGLNAIIPRGMRALSINIQGGPRSRASCGPATTSTWSSPSSRKARRRARPMC